MRETPYFNRNPPTAFLANAAGSLGQFFQANFLAVLASISVANLGSILANKNNDSDNTAEMDDFIVTAYPYAKDAIRTGTAVTAQFFKFVYPFLNSAYTSNPSVTSLILFVSAAVVVFWIVGKITSFVYWMTRNIFKFFLCLGLVLATVNYYNARAAGRVMDDGTVLPGFDWEGVYGDVQGFWGMVQNLAAMVMDMVESGSHLEEDGWNSGKRKTMGKKGDGMFAEPGRRPGGKPKWS